MSFRPQSSQPSMLVSYLQAGLLRGCRGCRQTSCCWKSTPAFRMWTTGVLKILVGEAEHLHAPPCTSMHLLLCPGCRQEAGYHPALGKAQRQQLYATRKCTTSTRYPIQRSPSCCILGGQEMFLRCPWI